jgi:hypothetical protein
MTIYCGPVTRLRILHIAEPGADFHAPAGCEPLTVCGLVMSYADIWMPLERREADPVCAACRGEAPVQLALVAAE